MALKLNIRWELEEEMEKLLPKAHVRSKTEYINQAIENYNHVVRRQIEINRLKPYFKSYQKEGKALLREFARLKPSID